MLIDFTRFCAKSTFWFVLAGFILAGILIAFYGSATNFPAFARGVLDVVETLAVIFMVSTVAAATLVVLRWIGRTLAETAFRRTFG